MVTAPDDIVASPLTDKIVAASQLVLEHIIQSHPVPIGYDQTTNVVPGMTHSTTLRAGPPVYWEKMCGVIKGAVTGALVLGRLVKDPDDAAELAASGKIIFSPCHEHDCVGPIVGVMSAPMFVYIVKSKTYGNRVYISMSEQMAKILRMGTNGRSITERLNWMRGIPGSMLRDAMELAGEIDLHLTLAQVLYMGDGCHNRNNAGTAPLIQTLTPWIT